MYTHPYLYDMIRSEHDRRINARRYDVPRASRRLARRSAAGSHRFSPGLSLHRTPAAVCSTC